MPDIFDLFIKWWKQIVGLMIITIAVTAVVLYTAPNRYLAVATALPAATYSSDKSAIFGQNQQTLYPDLGTPDDLDMILGTAHLDTVYNAVAEQLNLADYYGISKSDGEARQKAASILKEKTRVIKSDYGELKVKVRDGDRNQAAAMANAIMAKLQQMHQDVQTSRNAQLLGKIKEEYLNKQGQYQQLHDSAARIANTSSTAQLLTARQNSLLQQLQEYEKLIDQYELMVNAKPQALVIVEKANPPLWPDKPKPLTALLGAAVISLFFGVLAALLLERRRMSRP